MKPIEIKHAIECAGSTQAAIARDLHVTCATVNCVIWRGDVSAPVRNKIASVIGKDVADIWPGYYRKAS
ncbi:MAG: hypothetical protein JRD89_04565 [Deltaproteobacteria bacterium]|nr:hypothetical protein [Deltaproteobacteria bacterium]